MANESHQSFPEHAQRVEFQNRLQENIKKFIDNIFLNRKTLAKNIEDLTELGATPEKIQKVKDAARQQELAIAEILKDKQEQHSENFAKAPNPYANLDAMAKRIKNEDSLQAQSQEKLRKTQEALDALDEATDLQAIYGCLNVLQEQGYVFTKDQHGKSIDVTPMKVRDQVVTVLSQALQNENYSPQGILDLVAAIPHIADIHYKVLFHLKKGMENNQGWLSVNIPSNIKDGLYTYGLKNNDPLFNYDLKKSDSYFSDEPVTTDSIPNEKPEPKVQASKPEPEFETPKMTLSVDELRQQRTVDEVISKLQDAYMVNEPDRWLQLVSDPNFALLDKFSIRNPQRAEAKKWLDRQADELEGKKQLKALVTNISEYRASRPANGDYYTLLGVNKSAEKNTIKQAYFALISKFHPDKYAKAELLTGASSSDARDFAETAKNITKELIEAYEVLSDEVKRTQYDLYGSSTSSSYQEDPRAGANQSASQERSKNTVEMVLNSLRTASDLIQLRNALQSLVDLDYQFQVPENRLNEARSESPESILYLLDELDSLLEEGNTNKADFEAIFKVITRTEGVREVVKAIYEPIVNNITTLKSNASVPVLIGSLRELVRRNFIFSVKTKTMDGVSLESVVRYPIDIIRSMELVMSATSAQEAVNRAINVTSLHQLDLKVLAHLQRNTQGSRSPNWNWNTVSFPPRIMKRYRAFLNEM